MKLIHVVKMDAGFLGYDALGSHVEDLCGVTVKEVLEKASARFPGGLDVRLWVESEWIERNEGNSDRGGSVG